MPLIAEMIGYKPITTFYEDFTIADAFGVSAVKDTFNRAFREWKDNYKYLTELVMVLNWKAWEHDSKNNHKQFTSLYVELYTKAAEYAETHLKGDELQYYYQTTD